MRPIERGQCPVDEDGNNKEYSTYMHARSDLINKLGEYCSYCEMHLDSSLAVEHKLCKDMNPHLERNWENFLLSCINCNSTKGKININLSEYYWPDTDNTFRAFDYIDGGIIQVSESLSPTEKEIATNTLILTGLNKGPGTNNPKASDRRWLNRLVAWDKAKRAFGRLQQNNNKSMREQITETAISNGYWSIWMTVFKNDKDMLNRFISSFPGTAMNCFDTDCQPIQRNQKGL
jgi:uncharacterized protein (TIGR02646 family)